MKDGQCMATKAIMESGAQVGYLFREAADFPEDSGWRLFTGLESLDFVDNDDNIEIYDLADIIKLDGSIEPYLDAPVGTELERKEGSKEFTIIESE